MEKLHIMLVDDHIIFRQGVRHALQSEPDFEIVGEAADGGEAIQLARTLSPDIILMDINMPVVDGLEVTRRLRINLPRTGVIMLTAYDDDEQLFQSIKVGASAYFPKDVHPDDLAEGIRRVGKGEYIINDSLLSRPLLAARVLQQFRQMASSTEVEPFFAPLSPREMEILENIAKGSSNKEIARELKISDQTVKNHITSILRKLNVNDRTEAVVYALRHGWIKV
jgi:DNA-binding NarL/FixJ family response regulator